MLKPVTVFILLGRVIDLSLSQKEKLLLIWDTPSRISTVSRLSQLLKASSIAVQLPGIVTVLSDVDENPRKLSSPSGKLNVARLRQPSNPLSPFTLAGNLHSFRLMHPLNPPICSATSGKTTDSRLVQLEKPTILFRCDGKTKFTRLRQSLNP